MRESPAGLVAPTSPSSRFRRPSRRWSALRLDDLPGATRRVVLIASILGGRPELGELEAMLRSVPAPTPTCAARSRRPSGAASGATRGPVCSSPMRSCGTPRTGRCSSPPGGACTPRRPRRSSAPGAAARAAPAPSRWPSRRGRAVRSRDRPRERGRRSRARARRLPRGRRVRRSSGSRSPPASNRQAGRRGAELGLWLALGGARIVTPRPGRPAETKDAYDRASALSRAASETRDGFRALFGLRTYYLFAGEHDTSLTMAERSLQVAEAVGDEDLLVAGAPDGRQRALLGRRPRRRARITSVRCSVACPAGRDEQHLTAFAQSPALHRAVPCGDDPIAPWRRRRRADSSPPTACGTRRRSAIASARRWSSRCSAFCIAGTSGRRSALELGEELVALAEREGFPVYAAIGALVTGWGRRGSATPPTGSS